MQEDDACVGSGVKQLLAHLHLLRPLLFMEHLSFCPVTRKECSFLIDRSIFFLPFVSTDDRHEPIFQDVLFIEFSEDNPRSICPH